MNVYLVLLLACVGTLCLCAATAFVCAYQRSKRLLDVIVAKRDQVVSVWFDATTNLVRLNVVFRGAGVQSVESLFTASHMTAVLTAAGVTPRDLRPNRDE